MPHCGFDLNFPTDERCSSVGHLNIFGKKCLFRFFAYFIGFLAIVLFCFCCVIRLIYIFWVLVPFQIYGLEIRLFPFSSLSFHFVDCFRFCTDVIHFFVGTGFHSLGELGP